MTDNDDRKSRSRFHVPIEPLSMYAIRCETCKDFVKIGGGTYVVIQEDRYREMERIIEKYMEESDE